MNNNSLIEVYGMRIHNNFNKHQFERLLSCVSVEKRNIIRKYYNIEDAQRTLFGDILVRHLICKKLGLNNSQLLFDKNEYGKPFLKYNHNFCFNISHAGEWVVCAVHSLPVGVDIELIRPIDFDIAKRFFSQEEYYDLINIDNSQRLSYFYVLWTLKESYIKAAGKGLSIPLDSFTFRINDNGIIIETENKFRDFFFKRYNIDSNYEMAVCGCIDDFSKSVIEKELIEICEELLTT